VRHGGAAVRIDRDVAPFVGGQAGRLDAEPLDVGDAAERAEQLVGASRLPAVVEQRRHDRVDAVPRHTLDLRIADEHAARMRFERFDEPVDDLTIEERQRPLPRSIMVTCTPSAAKIVAYSEAMTPLPSTVSDFGR
jgi:hypothetical protein